MYKLLSVLFTKTTYKVLFILSVLLLTLPLAIATSYPLNKILFYSLTYTGVAIATCLIVISIINSYMNHTFNSKGISTKGNFTKTASLLFLLTLINQFTVVSFVH